MAIGVRLRPAFARHVLTYDFMQDRTNNGVPFRILNVIDEYTRECLAIKVARSLTHKGVLEVLLDLFLERGVPVHIRSDNGSEFTAKRCASACPACRSNRRSSNRASPEAQVLIEMWRRHDNTVRPHSSLGYRSPAPAAILGQPGQIQQLSLTL
jgi:transposase InsO family protein